MVPLVQRYPTDHDAQGVGYLSWSISTILRS